MNIILTIIIKEKPTKISFLKKFFNNFKILLLLLEDGRIMLPGGFVEGDEISEEDAMKETISKLGLEEYVSDINFKNYCEIAQDENNKYHLIVIYINDSSETITINPKTDEGVKEVLWVNPKQLISTIPFRNIFIKRKMTIPALKAIKAFLQKPIVNILIKQRET